MSFHARTQSYQFTGTMNGRVGMTPNIMMGGFFLGDHSEFRLDIGVVVRFEISFGSVVAGGAGWRIPMTLDLSWLSGFIGSPSPDSDTVFVIDVTGGPYEQPLTGTYTVDFGNCWEIVDTSDGIAGSSVLTDELNADRALRLVTRIKAGSIITATCDYGGAHVSKTATVTTDFDVPANTVTTVTATGNYGGSDMVVTNQIGGIAETTGGGIFSDTHHSGSWGPTCEIHADDGYTGRVVYTLSGLVQYNWSCKVNAVDVSYPGNLVARVIIGQDPFGSPITQDVTLTGGVGSLFIEQKSFIVSVEFEGSSVHSENVVTLYPVSAHLTSTSLAAAGEDTDLSLRNLWMHGWLWDAASIVQAVSIDAISGSWIATGSGGNITVAASTFDSRLRGTSWVGADLSGYAFADVYLTADAAGQPARINFDFKYWDVTVGTTGHARIDLCSPTSAHASTDTVESVYPYVGSGPFTAQDGWSFGVRNASGVVIDHLASGHVYTLTKITLIRTAEAHFSILDRFKAWELVEMPSVVGTVTSSLYYRTARWGDTDGQQSLQQTDASRLVLSGTSLSDTVSFQDIKTFVNTTNGSTGAYPSNGWTATDLQTNDMSINLRSGLLNSDRETSLLLGSGIWFDGTSWQIGLDKSVASTLTLKAQYIFNSIVAYPGAGDIWGWGGGGYGTPVELKCGIVLRGEAWGLVFDGGTKARQPGVTVTVKDHTTHVVEGLGNSNTFGEFITGTPGIIGQTIADINSILSQTFPTRSRRKFAILETLAGKGISYDCSVAGRHVIAYALTSGTINVGFASNALSLDFNFTDSGVMGFNPYIKYDKLSNFSTVNMAYEVTGGGIYVVTSNDERTWSAPMTVNSDGTHASYAPTRQATKHFFWYKAGTIEGVVWDSLGNVIVPKFTAVASGVDDDMISSGEFVTSAGEHRIGLTYLSGGTPTFVSASDTMTFV